MAASLLVAHASAQQPPRAPVFRSAVDLVQLDVIVTDKDGKPVTDLKSEEFVVTEQGRAQDIAAFESVSIPAARRNETPLSGVTPVRDVVSNARPADARQWVLVIDDLHLLETNIIPTQRVIREFLLSLPSQDLVAVVFTGRSDLSVDFTNDLSLLSRTAARLRDALGFAPDATNGQPWRDRARLAGATAHVLANVGKTLSDSSYARKAIVYVGDGMAYGRQDIHLVSGNNPQLDVLAVRDVFTQIDNMMRGLARVGVPLYTLDPRGLVDCNAVRGACSEPPRGNIRRQTTMLQEFAENTGGKAFVNRADTMESVRLLIEDNSHYYLLGYYPTATRRPGAFQEVKVRVTRPGVQVRARAGYVVPTPESSKAGTAGQQLNRVLSSASVATGLDMRATTAIVGVGDRGMRTAVTAEVVLPVLAGAQNTAVTDDLDFAVVALDHEGKVRAESRRTFQFTGRSAASSAVVLVNDIIDVPGEPVTLRLAVASKSSGLSGSVHVPVHATPPRGDDVQLGGIVIGGVGAQTGVLGQLPETVIPVQPVPSREFAVTDVLRVWMPVFWRNGEGTVPTVVLRVRKPDAVVAEHSAVVSASAITREIHAAGAAAQVPLAGLAPGEYVLEAVATRAGRDVKSVAIQVRVLPKGRMD